MKCSVRIASKTRNAASERRWNPGTRPPTIGGVPDPELAALLESIRHRGQADVPGATRMVEDYLTTVLRDAGAAGDPSARRWARDRLRLFMVVSWGNWFGVLERLPQEYSMLRDEWRA